MKLTDQVVARLVLPPGKSDHIEPDDEIGGFGVRLRAGGSKKWVYSYTLGSKQRRITLGSVKILGATQARTTARDLAAKVRLGGDPAGERDEGRVRAAETLGATAPRFLSRQRAHLRPGSYVECERHLLTHAKPLHGLQIGKVDRRAIAALLAEIGATRGPIAANRVRATLSALFAWALKEGLVDSNPTVATNSFAEQPRDRVLTGGELRAIWNALPQSHYGAILKLLMLTGQRLTEIADLRWSEIDFDKGVIRLPRERVKNNRPHEIPISAWVREILEAQARREGRDFVFGEGSRGFHGWSAPKIRLDEQTRITPWRLHDIRRSVATHMAELGVQPHVIEQILNHQSGHKRGVAGIYNRSTYANEMRRALDLWGAHVGGLVGDKPSNISPMNSQVSA
jgi:integrase